MNGRGFNDFVFFDIGLSMGCTLALLAGSSDLFRNQKRYRKIRIQ